MRRLTDKPAGGGANIGRTLAIIAEPPISSRPCRGVQFIADQRYAVERAKSGSVTFPLLMSLISGTLLSTGC